MCICIIVLFGKFALIHDLKMPLILMVGFPSSGKTTRAREIQKYFTENQQRNVVLISDNEIISQMNMDKNVLFLGKYIHTLL